MKESASITRWLEGLKVDSSLAAQNLWETYFRQMIKIARQRLPAE